jgi:hypothetical protein
MTLNYKSILPCGTILHLPDPEIIEHSAETEYYLDFRTTEAIFNLRNCRSSVIKEKTSYINNFNREDCVETLFKYTT